MVHKPKHKVHSFRALLGDGGQDEINLERQNVNLAYRIVKFAIIQKSPGASGTDNESIVQVWREKQTSVVSTIDFSNTDLLGAGFYSGNPASDTNPNDMIIIFDNILFSRNIFVTYADARGVGDPCNYYIEIEEVPVSPSTLMQLKLGTARKLIGAKMGA